MLSHIQHVYVSGGLEEKALKVSFEVIEFIKQLRSNNEEAVVLFVNHYRHMSIDEILFKKGRKSINSDITRFIPVHTVAGQLSGEQSYC